MRKRYSPGASADARGATEDFAVPANTPKHSEGRKNCERLARADAREAAP